jgi:hypothetical protein
VTVTSGSDKDKIATEPSAIQFFGKKQALGLYVKLGSRTHSVWFRNFDTSKDDISST